MCSKNFNIIIIAENLVKIAFSLPCRFPCRFPSRKARYGKHKIIIQKLFKAQNNLIIIKKGV